MSSPLVISSIDFLKNPAAWSDPYQLQITFEAHEVLQEDVEWQLIYVGSPTDESVDQVLETVVVGPICTGRHKFVLEANAPDPSKIPAEYIQDITILLLKCYYNGKLFSKIGWFVTNEYEDEELQTNKPTKPVIEKLRRQIKIDDVRVTQYPNCWREDVPPEVVDADDEDQDIAFTVGTDAAAPADDEEEEEDDAGDDEEDADVPDEVDLSAVADADDEGETEADVDATMESVEHNSSAENAADVDDGKNNDAKQPGSGGDVLVETTNA